ncbi:F-box/LRR-repeat protein At3g26922-like [Silene latifolia]|uniref:F-box/LRR-repeat protein At3g26922-like n=1 Tax=Silene latifolia TaxID=37657 RepID=UPI003D77750D
MKPQKRMRSSKVVGLDRLSEMPDQVIVHILSFMPTRDAVKTMLLRRFGNLWTMLPALSFDFDDHDVSDENEDGGYEEKDRIISEAFSRFARFVRNVLLLHRRSTIDSFYLDIGECKSDLVDPCLIDDVQVWLKFATDREVKNLVFHCDYDDKIVLPRCVFTSQSLVTLTLWGSMLVEYVHQSQLHMGALRKLSLVSVTGSNKAFNQLISACPSIQKLKVYNSRGLQDLNIIAPSANRLDLDIDVADRPFTLNCPHVESLNIAVYRQDETSQSNLLDVIDVSSLQDVFVKGLPNDLSGPIIKAYLRHFRNVGDFALSGGAFKQLCCLKKVDILQNSWQSLSLQPRWDNERCLQVIIELMKSSVDLEELVVDAGSSRSEDDDGVLSSELSTSCEMPLLKSVFIYGYGKCREGQLQLIEFVLRNAIILEKLVITCEENKLTAVEELEFLKQVLRFKRASENVIVEFA